MRIQNKWLLSVVAITSISINSVESRVPYAVAKAYLPKLLEAIGIEDKERKDKDAQNKALELKKENTKKDEIINKNEYEEESKTVKEYDDEMINEIKVDNEINTNKKENVKNKNVKEKEDDKPTEKEKAILDMIYTDEGQYRMVDWQSSGLVPDTINNSFKDIDPKETLDHDKKFFDTSIGFSVSIGDKMCSLGASLSSKQSFAATLFEKYSKLYKFIKSVKSAQQAIEKGKEETEVVKDLYNEIKDLYNELKEKDDNNEPKDDKEKLVTVLKNNLEKIGVKKKAKLQHISKNKKLSELLKITENLIKFIYNKDINSGLNDFVNLGSITDKLARIIYLLCICDVESDLKNIINSINIATYITTGKENNQIKDLLVNKGKEGIYSREYDCRPVPYSFSPKYKTYEKLQKNGKFGALSGSCTENLIRHLITIALRPAYKDKKDKKDSINPIAEKCLFELKEPQSGIINSYKHTSWRDEVLRKIIDEYFENKNNKLSSNETESGGQTLKEPIPQIDSGLETICYVIDIISQSICNGGHKDIDVDKKSYEKSFGEDGIEYVGIAKNNNIVPWKILETAMNNIYKKFCPEGATNVERFKVELLMKDKKYSSKKDAMTYIFDQNIEWSGETFGIGFTEWIEDIVIIYDHAVDKGYVLGLSSGNHCEIIRVLNLHLAVGDYEEDDASKFDMKVTSDYENESINNSQNDDDDWV